MQKVPIPTEIIQRISNPHCSLSPPWVFVARPRAVVLLSSEERFELRSSPLARARSTVTQKRNMRQFAVSDFKNKPSEAKCRTFLVIMSFICMRIKNHFHINGFAFSLALKQRLGTTRKWPNVLGKLHRTSLHSLRAAVIKPLLQALPPCYPKYFAGDIRRMFLSIYLWGAPALILSLSHSRLLAIII